jgi:hypothetical protein
MINIMKKIFIICPINLPNLTLSNQTLTKLRKHNLPNLLTNLTSPDLYKLSFINTTYSYWFDQT